MRWWGATRQMQLLCFTTPKADSQMTTIPTVLQHDHRRCCSCCCCCCRCCWPATLPGGSASAARVAHTINLRTRNGGSNSGGFHGVWSQRLAAGAPEPDSVTPRRRTPPRRPTGSEVARMPATTAGITTAHLSVPAACALGPHQPSRYHLPHKTAQSYVPAPKTRGTGQRLQFKFEPISSELVVLQQYQNGECSARTSTMLEPAWRALRLSGCGAPAACGGTALPAKRTQRRRRPLQAVPQLTALATRVLRLRAFAGVPRRSFSPATMCRLPAPR